MEEVFLVEWEPLDPSERETLSAWLVKEDAEAQAAADSNDERVRSVVRMPLVPVGEQPAPVLVSQWLNGVRTYPAADEPPPHGTDPEAPPPHK